MSDDKLIAVKLRPGDEGPCETEFDEPDKPCGATGVYGYYDREMAESMLEEEPRDPSAASPDLAIRFCELCYRRALRVAAEEEQSVEFERRHGYPPNVSLEWLRKILSQREGRHRRLVELNAPEPILVNEARLVEQAKSRLEAYLRDHPDAE